MNFFDRYTQSRNAAIYAWLRAQNTKVAPYGNEPAVGGAGWPRKESEPVDPDKPDDPDTPDTPDTPDEPVDESTHVESLDEIANLINDPDTPEVEITVDKSMTVEGNTSLIVENGKTVTLNVPAGVTLDAGNISDKSTSDCVIAVKNGGTLVINGEGTIGSEDKGCGIKVTANDSVVGVSARADSNKTAKVIVNGGHIIGQYYAIAGNGTRPNTYVEVNGGTLEGKALNDNCAIFNPQGDSKLIINGGTFIGAMGIYVKAGEITINGGKFAANGVKADYKYSGNGFNNTGDCIVLDNCNYPGGNPSVNVVAGEFVSANASAFASYAGAKAGQQVPDRIVGFVHASDKVEVTEAVPSEENVYVV